MTPTLLVVDDNASVLVTLRFILARRGYNVRAAGSGAQALGVAREQAIDAAILDVHMPVMNGFELCRALREHAASAGRPIAIWMITGARTAEVERLAMEAGALAVLKKPFDEIDLFRRLEDAIGPPGLAEKE